MKEKILKFCDFVLYWSIVILPFSTAISNAAMNVFTGYIIFAFVLKKIIKRERIFIKTSLDMPIFLFFAVTVLSLFNAVSIKDSLRGGLLRLSQYIVLFFIMAESVKDKKHIYRIIIMASTGLILTSFNEIWQVVTGKDFIRGYDSIVNIGLVRATSSFKDSNTLGIYISALSPIIFGLTLFYFKGVKRVFFIIISILALVAAALTYSRPTLLAVFIALFFLAVAGKSKWLTMFLIVTAILFPLLLPNSVKQWAGDVGYNPLRFMCNDDRIAIYRNSINMIKAHPVIGVGVNNFMKSYKYYKESPEYRNVVTIDNVYAHNNFLHMAAEIGLIGLAIFLWILFRLFGRIRRITRGSKEGFYRVISISLCACLIAFLVNGLTESSLYSSRVAFIFWYLAGFSFAMGKFKDGI